MEGGREHQHCSHFPKRAPLNPYLNWTEGFGMNWGGPTCTQGPCLLVLSCLYPGLWVCCVSVSFCVLWHLPLCMHILFHMCDLPVYTFVCLCVLRLCVCPLQLYVYHGLVCSLSPLCMCVYIFACPYVCPCVSGRFSVAHWVYHGDQLSMSTLDPFIVGAPGVGIPAHRANV